MQSASEFNGPSSAAGFEVGGITFDRWLETVGRSRETGWRWVQAGMLAPVNILGKHFITREEDQRFWRRAKAGEFSREILSVEEKVRRRAAP